MVALVYGVGVVFADVLPTSPSVFGALAVCAGLAATALAWARARPMLTWMLLFSFGVANLSFRQAVISPHDLRTIVGAEPKIAMVRGSLVETPYHRYYEHHEEQTWRTIAQVEVSGVRFQGSEWRQAAGRVSISTPGILPGDFFGGRVVQIDGVLCQPRPPLAEGVFDYRKFLNRQGVYYQLQVASTNDWRAADAPGREARRPLADRFGDWGRAMLARGLPVEDEPLRLLWAMTLGWKTALNGEVSEPFMRSGTMHIFAISGLHIALIAGLLVKMLRVLRVPSPVCGFVVIPLIWLYTGVTGWQASAIRSTLMMSVVIGGWSLKRPSDLINSLAAAAFVILVWDPQQLFQASFQLSFFVVLSLALIVPLFDELHRPLMDPLPSDTSSLTRDMVERLIEWLPWLDALFPDPLLPVQEYSAFRRRFGHVARFLYHSFVTSLAAWFGSIPLVAFYFHLITPASLIANLLVVPLSSFALACNMGSLAVGGALPGVAELFNNAAWLFMVLMVRLSEWAARLPGGCFHLGTPSVLFFALYYGVLVSLLAGWLVRPRLRWWAGGGLALLAACCVFEWRHGRTEASLTVLPLNGGESVYFRPTHGGEDWLIDCGDESTAEFVMKPYLRGQGVNHPANFLLTHGDVHNVGGARLIQDIFAPRRVFFSHATFRASAYREMVRDFEQTPGLARRLQRGDHVGPWTVLHPDREDHFTQADDAPVVLHGVIEGVSVLLLSDLGKSGQNALLERYPDLRADVVVSGIPTQTEPLAGAFLDALRPQLIVISDSEYPAAQRASRKLRERLDARGVPIIYTRDAGAVTVMLHESRWRVRAMNGLALPKAEP